jgi:hypothetical protein
MVLILCRNGDTRVESWEGKGGDVAVGPVSECFKMAADWCHGQRARTNVPAVCDVQWESTGVVSVQNCLTYCGC